MGKSSINKMLNKIDNHLLSHSNSKRCFVFLLETMKILSTKHKDRVSVPYTYHLQVADTPYFQLLLRFLKVLLYDIQAQMQEFPYGGSSTTIASRASRLAGCYITAGGLGSTQGPRSPWVFGAKSCNLAISMHFIQTFGEFCFPKLIVKDFQCLLVFVRTPPPSPPSHGCDI